MSEFKGKRIIQGRNIFYEKLSPLQLLHKSEDLIGYVNTGTTTIGSSAYGDEGDIYMKNSETTSNDLTNFLDFSTCSIKDIPNNLKEYINQIPDKYQPTLPYIWIYIVSY